MYNTKGKEFPTDDFKFFHARVKQSDKSDSLTRAKGAENAARTRETVYIVYVGLEKCSPIRSHTPLRIIFCARIEGDPVLQIHYHQPRAAVLSPEYRWEAIVKFISIAAGLIYPRINVLLLCPFALNMYAGEAGQVRRGPIAYSLSRFNSVSVTL